jgi:hypothetical protein
MKDFADFAGRKTTASVPATVSVSRKCAAVPDFQFRYTPVLENRKLTMPVLILQGDTDIQVDHARPGH